MEYESRLRDAHHDAEIDRKRIMEIECELRECRKYKDVDHEHIRKLECMLHDCNVQQQRQQEVFCTTKSELAAAEATLLLQRTQIDHLWRENVQLESRLRHCDLEKATAEQAAAVANASLIGATREMSASDHSCGCPITVPTSPTITYPPVTYPPFPPFAYPPQYPSVSYNTPSFSSPATNTPSNGGSSSNGGSIPQQGAVSGDPAKLGPDGTSGLTGPSNKTPISFRLELDSLTCNKTTESGADEVYILVAGTSSDGRKFSARLPSDSPNQSAGHWDMNDGDQPTNNPDGDSHAITAKGLFNGEICDGQSWQIVVLIMEEDGGTTKAYQQAAATALEQVPNPYAQGAGLVLDALTKLGFFFTDTDDYIGSFGIFATVASGKVVTEWKGMDRVSSGGEVKKAASQTYDFNGDGSAYSGTFSVK